MGRGERGDAALQERGRSLFFGPRGGTTWPGHTEAQRLGWQAAGFDDPAVAGSWSEAGFTPEQAAPWNQAGLSAEQAIGGWIESGLAPQRCLEFINAGVAPGAARIWSSLDVEPGEAGGWAASGVDPSFYLNLGSAVGDPVMLRVPSEIVARPDEFELTRRSLGSRTHRTLKDLVAELEQWEGRPPWVNPQTIGLVKHEVRYQRGEMSGQALDRVVADLDRLLRHSDIPLNLYSKALRLVGLFIQGNTGFKRAQELG